MASSLCPNCRKPLSENARFCIECGSRIDFGVTRKEMGNDSLEVGGGLRVNRSETASSPFYGKYNSLKDKIINPKLSPLPEKKSFTFKSWDEIKSSNVESETEGSIDEIFEETKVSEESIEVTVKENVEEELSDSTTDTEVAESEEPEHWAEVDVGDSTASEESNEISTEEVAEETIELQEEATDFEALKELFSETDDSIDHVVGDAIASEEPIEEIAEEELPNLASNIEIVETEELDFLAEAIADDSTASDGSGEIPTEEAEETVELQEEATDFEALKELFSETEESIDEVLEETTASEDPIEVSVEENAEGELSDTTTETEAAESEEAEHLEEVDVDDSTASGESDEILVEEITEETVELREEVADFEALQERFCEPMVEERIIEQSIDNAEDSCSSVEMETEVVEDNVNDSLLAGMQEHVASHEQNSDYDTETFVKHLSEKICDQVDTEIEIPDVPPCNNVNRIITSTVGGGFKRRASQAEEVKEITSFFGKKRKR